MDNFSKKLGYKANVYTELFNSGRTRRSMGYNRRHIYYQVQIKI